MDRNTSLSLNNFCLSEGLITTFFHLNVVMNDVTFHNGRKVSQKSIHGTQLETWMDEANRNCLKTPGHIHIFAEPPNNNPLSLLKGLFGPIADLQRSSPNAKLAVWRYPVDHPFKKFVERFKNLQVLNPEKCECFEEATWHLANSGNIASFRAAFDNIPPERIVTFLLVPGATVENAAAIANKICEGCTPVICHINDDVNTITTEILRSKALVSQLVDFLGWAFLLETGSTLAVMSEGTLTDPWLVEFVGFLRLMFTILQIKTVGDVITFI
jgi:hypothetical protein